MIKILHWKTILYIVVGLTTLVAAIGWIFNEPDNTLDFLKLFGGVGFVFTILVIGIGETFLFRILCKKTKLGKIFPEIHGDWEADIFSNWPTIAEKCDIKDSNGEPFKENITKTTVNIKASLLSISIHLNSNSGYQDSRTLSSSIKKDTHGNYELCYIYRAFVNNPKPSDEQSFLGAGLIRFSDLKNNTLKGEFWTNRKWKEGLNTAGTITLKRIEDE